ncbi:MAG TPA: TolC family protein [Bacteroidota bacterium]|nr:TolC family protein [Bacteroidota bacterium]
MKRNWIFLLFPFLVIRGSAAEKQTIWTLNECIDRALKTGYAVVNASSQYRASRSNYEAAKRRLRTSVAASLDLPNYQEALSNQFDPLSQQYKYFNLTTTRMQGSLSISQPILFTGGTLTVSDYVFGRDQTSGGSSARAGKDYFNNFLVEFRQPLFTTNQLRLGDERSRLSFEQAQADFAKNQLDIVYAVTESFYTTYQAVERYSIVKEQVRQNEESYQTAKRKFEFGLIPEVEALQSEVDLAGSQNDLLNASRDVERTKNQLKLLLGLSLGDQMEPSAVLEYTPLTIDSARAIETALTSRAEIQSALRSVQQRELDIDAARSRNEFRMDISATYGYNKSALVADDLLGQYGRTRSAALTVTLPLFDWGAHSYDVQAAQIQFDNALAAQDYVQDQIRQEILDLLGRINAADSRIRVLQKNVAVAQKGYDISLERFRTGTIGRNDLAQAQQRLTTTKLNSLSAQIEYKLGIADLKRKTLFDFERGRPVTPVIDGEQE